MAGGLRVILETDRLVLRRLSPADADNLAELDSDPDVMRFLSGGSPTPREVIEREILPGFLRDYDRFPGFGVWAAIEKASGEFLGWFSFRPREDGSALVVSLGYRLRKSAWGKGYATEGSRALIRKGFTELRVDRVLATTYQDNLASRRVMEKAGMTLARTYRITAAELAASDTFEPGSDIWDGDDVEYALDKAEWDARNRHP